MTAGPGARAVGSRAARGRALLVAALWAAGPGAAGRAGAAPPSPRAHLIYVRDAAADACPDEESVRQAVAARLGYDPFSPRAARTVTVAVRASAAGLSAHIELSDATGEVTGRQQLLSPRRHCRDLAPALALAVVLAIDPLGGVRPEAPAAGGQPEPPVEPTPMPDLPANLPPVLPLPPSPPPPPPRPPTPPPRESTRVRLGAGALLSLGTAPAPTAGLAVLLGLRESAWSVNLEVRGDLPASADFGGGRVSTWLLAGVLSPCLHFPVARGRLEIAPCGVLLVGAQLGRGEGYAQNLAPVDPMVFAGARLLLEVPLAGRLSLSTSAELLASVASPRLLVGPDVAWRAAPVGGSVGAGLVYTLR